MKSKEGIPSFVGTRVKRREDPDLITGRGKYVADIHMDGMLHMAVVRSPYAHARILKIDTSKALAIPGVQEVLTAEDINAHLAVPMPLSGLGDQHTIKKDPRRYPLATGKVLYIGDPVAVVVADDPYAAADAVANVTVDYEPLSALSSPEAALAPDAPVLHEAWNDNIAFRTSKEGGNVDEAFAQAETVIEIRLVNQRLIPNAIEPRAVAATYDPGIGSFTVWTTTQTPHSTRGFLAEVFALPEDQIRVIAPEVGGGFGAKANQYGEEVLVPFLARMLEYPVKWVGSRMEDYIATIHGRDQIDVVRLAADREGRVQAIDLDITAVMGGYYGPISPMIPALTVDMMTGVYDIPNARARTTGVFTNRHPTEPYRGAGRPEAAFLVERAMDTLANELKMDPAELRFRNFIPPDKFPYKNAQGLTYDSGEYDINLRRALELVNYPALRVEQVRRRTEGGRLMGIGVACYVEICGFGPWEMGTILVNDEGHVTILTGTSPHGQGHETTWAQIASDELQIPPENITVKHGDTAVVPRGIGTFGSRSTSVGGSAVQQNAESVREQAKEIAAHLLEAAVEDMTLTNGFFHVQGVPGHSLTWGEIVHAAQSDQVPGDLRGELKSDVDFKPKGDTYPFGTHVCVVEIDPETGQLEITRYLTVDDCGKVINPLLVEGQVHGGIAQGIGQALFEGAVYDSAGNLLTGSLIDYALPKAQNFPVFETHRTETPSPLNKLGVKGIGEAATVGSTPAVANAVVDALSHMGVRNLDMPFTPEKIWRAIQGK